MNKQSGFTLVEIAMVLIVITLIIGGVLKGAEMIRNAKMKKFGMQHEALNVAVLSFRDRYGFSPGDLPNADEIFDAYNGHPEVNGDGDYRIGYDTGWDMDPTTPWTAGEQENLKFWAHLRASGIIAGDPFDGTPLIHVWGGPIGIQDGSLGIPTHVLVYQNVPGFEAELIDNMFDTGDSTTGDMRAGSTEDSMDHDTAPVPVTEELRYNIAWKIES